jgi:hypothetical protein
MQYQHHHINNILLLIFLKSSTQFIRPSPLHLWRKAHVKSQRQVRGVAG